MSDAGPECEAAPRKDWIDAAIPALTTYIARSAELMLLAGALVYAHIKTGSVLVEIVAFMVFLTACLQVVSPIVNVAAWIAQTAKGPAGLILSWGVALAILGGGAIAVFETVAAVTRAIIASSGG